MSHDYLPARDESFLGWTVNFLKYLMSRTTKFNFPKEVYDRLEEEKNIFAQKLEVSKEPATHTPINVSDKKVARKILQTDIRQSVGEYLIRNHLLTDGDRRLLGLPVHDVKPTPAPAPTDVPVGSIDASKIQQHNIHVRSSMLVGKAKPPRVHGFEVWNKVGGTIPTESKEWTYVNFSSRTPMLVKYEQSERGQMVYYRIRWMSTRNEPGPWSEIHSAIIP
jgi:hypothetical protein